MNIEQNTKHASRATQVERQKEKKAYTHDTDSQKQPEATKQGMCVKETLAQAIIGKAPRLEIHTRSYLPNVQAVVDTTRKGLLVDCITTLEKT